MNNCKTQTINQTIQEVCSRYSIPVYVQDYINEANDPELQFTIHVDLFLEVMLLEIRGTSLKFSSNLKKEKLNREKTLMKLIERSESCISNPICTDQCVCKNLDN